MNNEMYLIHKDDYINHIDNQIRLYVMVKQLAVNIKRLAPNCGSKKITDMANHYNAIAESMFKNLGIPKSYILFGDEDALAELMENELIAPEDAGYYPIDDEDECDGECCCGDCDNCCFYDEDDEDECDDDEAIAEFMEGFDSLLTDFNELARSIFGDNVSVHIIVD